MIFSILRKIAEKNFYFSSLDYLHWADNVLKWLQKSGETPQTKGRATKHDDERIYRTHRIRTDH